MRHIQAPGRWGKAAQSGILLAGLLALSLPAHAQDEAPQVQAGVVAPGTITVDGKLDEPAWQQAGVIEDLTQQSPKPGQATPYHTKIRLLRDKDTLYIGVECSDPDMSKAVSHTLVRDASQNNDDYVLFVLDTFGTKRYAYIFQVNSAGAMADGLLSPSPSINVYNGVDYNWDGVWKAVVTQDAHGWTAEIAIDTRSLQFTTGLARWGLNVTRNVPRDLLTLDWSGTTLDSTAYQLQREGLLTGMEGMEQGVGLDFQPYGLAKYQTGSGTTSNTGFDLKYDFNPALEGLFTYHTDFAEAEADQQQINSGRFPIFFPEKRQFFLQGSNLFSFAYNLGNSLGTAFLPFNSRNIGLVDGAEVPLNEGVKIIGQSDSGSLALLDTQMAGAANSDATNLFVGRATYNIDPQLQVGTMVTHGDPLGMSSNTFVGADAIWKTSQFAGDKNLNLSGWAGHSSGNLPAGNDNTLGFDLEYPNDLWYIHSQYGQFGDGFDPALGFLSHPGTRHYLTGVSFQPRPAADSLFDWVHQFYFFERYEEYDGFGPTDGGKQTSEFRVSPEMLTQGGWYWEVDYFHEFDAPTQSFEPVPNVAVPAGRYTYDDYEFNFQSPSSQPLWWAFVDTVGPFYAGTAQHPYVQLNWNSPSGQVVLTAQQEDFFYHSPQGHGSTRLSTLIGTYSFTPNFYITTQMQYNNSIPGISSNTQLRWIVADASNIYLVFNHGVVTETNGLGKPVVSNGNEVILKVQWDLRE